ncbi:glycosyltransferase family 4 protein [Haloarcula amylolytica]|uniref:glycosyltransferase family 4 protein n=1 Tax=Haloarcula amylolytica TaxID=396317 RepID=UPI003C731333
MTDITILHLIPNYSQTNLKKGVSQYAKSLSEMGHDVTLVIYETKKNEDENLDIPNVEIDRISIRDESKLIRTTSYILSCDTDVIISQNVLEKRYLIWVALAWAQGIDFLMKIDYTPGIPPLTPSIRIKHRVKLQILSEFCRGLFVPTQNAADELVSIYPKLDHRVQSLPSGYNDEYFVERKESNKSILYAGRLVSDKGVRDLICGFNKIKDEYSNWTLEIAGDGKIYDDMNKENVQFHGHVETQELIDLYAKAEIFCLPSLHESFGNVLVEAAGAETAIISTEVGVAPELLDGAGLFINKRDSDDIAEKLRTYIDNDDKRRADAKKLKQNAKNYKIERVTKIISEYL